MRKYSAEALKLLGTRACYMQTDLTRKIKKSLTRLQSVSVILIDIPSSTLLCLYTAICRAAAGLICAQI